jgi:hypothetical protein
MKYLIVLFMVSFLLMSCEDLIEGPEDEMNPGDPAVVRASFSSIQQNVFTPTCAVPACHGGTQSPNLSAGSAYNNLVNVVSTGNPALLRVRPGDSGNSWLIRKLNGTGTDRMPPDGPLSRATIDSIALWIDKGAANN